MKWTRVARLGAWLRQWPVALATIVVLAALILVPGIGSVGFWEPQERQLVDKVAPRDELAAKKAIDDAKQKAAVAETRRQAVDNAKKAGKPVPPDPNDDTCLHAAPEDALARSLANRAPAFGRDVFGDSDAGRRLPLVLLAFVTVLAAAGIAMRVLGTRAGIVTALVLLSFPLLVLQARMVSSDIGTACGATLVIYGLVAIGPRRGVVRGVMLDVASSLVGALALASGLVIGFLGGGILFGTIVPLGAIAAASGFGVPLARSIYRGRGDRARAWFELAKVVFATLVVIAAIAWLAYTIYEIRRPYPGMVPPARSIAGKVIAPTGCWSSALGGIWKTDDDLRMIYDSTFEQIAYGTFPWGILAPLAIAGLLRAKSSPHRRIGRLALAWAAASWLASEVFTRKVGFTIYAGFPAMAIAIAGWLDLVIARRAERERIGVLHDAGIDDGGRGDGLGTGAAYLGPALLVGLFVALGVLDLGKDLQSFTDHITSLLTQVWDDGTASNGVGVITYPTGSTLWFVPLRVWILVWGMLVALPFAAAMSVWHPAATLPAAKRRRWAARATAAALAATVAMAAFWSFAWLPDLAIGLSSKTMFDTWVDERAKGDQLVVMGDLGDAPTDYADGKFEKVDSRDQIVASLARPNRVFAIAPQTELCTLHREIGGKPYFVLDDRNARSILLTNKLGEDDVDRNPLAFAIVHSEPKDIPQVQDPKKPIIWDKKIQLLGWDIPKVVSRGARFDVTMYYKILAPVGGAWTTLMHFDGPIRFSGDHKPINDRCPTSTWQNGDYIIDKFSVTAGGATFSPGPYELWTGFFTGTSPNFKNMTVSDAPQGQKDPVDRVKIMTVTLD